MIISITKSTPELVRPRDEVTEKQQRLPLSFMDRNPGLRVLIETVFVYRNGKRAAEVIKEALSKALVYYYPVAGRIVETAEGEPEIACTGDGVWFVEASANCSLMDVNYLQLPLAMVSKEDLLPFPPPKVDEKDVILLLQVTQFICGGFAVGLRSTHTVFDGVGQGQFMKAVGELARGLAKPSVEPIWCRDAIPDPPKQPLAPPPPLATFDLEHSTLDIPLEHINQLKKSYMEKTGQRCSTFDVLVAKTWQCRTRTIANINIDEEVQLGFAVNTRHLMGHFLPEQGRGYYGNCIYNMSISAGSQVVAGSPLVHVIGLIREAKKRAATEFSEWILSGKMEEARKVRVGYGTLCVLDWSRVGFLDVDYGWGEPLHGAPLSENKYVGWCILMKPLPPKQGVRLIMQCVERRHLPAFTRHMINYLSP